MAEKKMNDVELEAETAKKVMQKIRYARTQINKGETDSATRALKEVELFLLIRLTKKQ